MYSMAFDMKDLNVVSNPAPYERALRNLFPASPELEAAVAGLSANSIDLSPKINDHTFLFSELDMQFVPDYQSFVTKSGKNGLASIRGVPVSKQVDSYVEIMMNAAGDDRLYLYLKSPSETYYFFGFKDGILHVTSNNSAFMNELETMKAKDLVMKMDDGETYEILPVQPGDAARFLRRMEVAFESR